MAQAAIEPGDPLYGLVAMLDLSQVAPKLHCGRGNHFLLNAFKTACCDTAICESCNGEIEGTCPVCKHEPFISKPNKTLRNTARGYLKDKLAKAAPLQLATPVEPIESVTATAGEPVVSAGYTDVNEVGDGDRQESHDIARRDSMPHDSDVVESQTDAGNDIEEHTQERSRRNTLDSTSGNEHDDDIEILVGNNDNILPDPEQMNQFDEYGEEYGQAQTQDGRSQSLSVPAPEYRNRPDQPFQQGLDNNNNSSTSNNGWNQNMLNVNDMANIGMGMNNFGNPNMMQMMMNMQQMMTMNGGNMTPEQFQMMSMMPNFQGMFGANGMPGGNQWYNNMMGQGGYNDFNNQMFTNQNGGFGHGPQFQNSYGNNRQFSKRGGRFRGRGNRGFQYGRGSFYGQQDYHSQNNAFDEGFHNSQYQQSSHSQYEGQSFADRGNTNDKASEPTADEDDFAPAGQDEVREALGDQYKKVEAFTPEEPALEQVQNESTPEHRESMNQASDPQSELGPSPKPSTPKEPQRLEDIPEAYREDIDFPMAPPTAPSGPSSKDYPYRNRGAHNRFPSRGGRGSYQLANGHHPPSPARSLSQSQTQSPTSNKGIGVVGAPTGPKAMREKEAPPPTGVARSNSDTGFRIMGRANMKKEDLDKESHRQSVSPRRSHDDEHESSARETSKRQPKHDTRNESRQKRSRHEVDMDDHEHDYTRRRRESRQVDEYDDDTQRRDDDYYRSESLERKDAHRSSRREREKSREKYSSGSKHRSSKRYEDDDDDGGYQRDDYGEAVDSKSYRPSRSSGRYEDRDERREMDYERMEKDKYRKRSRHDRDREDEYEDIDEEENRRRSRKHKKEHQSSSRRDRERENEDADLGLRISGRSTSHRNSEATTPTTATAPVPDVDPHEGERERRNRERMAKEEQRRQAAKGLSGGRRVSYKYEDEIERSLAKSSRRR